MYLPKLRQLLRNDSKDWVQLVSWQRDFVVVPPTSWVCDLVSAVVGPGHGDPDDGDQKDFKVIVDFREFWDKKKCYGNYRDAREAFS